LRRASSAWTSKPKRISKIIRDQIGSYAVDVDVAEVGTIVSVGDGIARVHGVEKTMAGEMLEFPHGIFGIALNLEEESVGAVLPRRLHRDQGRRPGQAHRPASFPCPVGPELIGRVVNALGQPIDGKGPITPSSRCRSSASRPGVVDRSPVKEPMQTGLKAIDAMVPIGRGQRELIIGDRQTGKTAVAWTRSSTRRGRTSSASTTRSAEAVHDRAGGADARRRRRDGVHHRRRGGRVGSGAAALHQPVLGLHDGRVLPRQRRHALVIYDDLSKHAQAYREISLLLRRPPGREAYPGDVFYLHSRLLERAAKLKKENGGGSLTALPIIETQAGDLSAYIPTNVISITGRADLPRVDLFHQGIRPAINVGNSVSRVGGSAQVQGDAPGGRHAATRPRPVPRARGVRAVRLRPRQGDAQPAQSRPPARRSAEAAAVPAARGRKAGGDHLRATNGYVDPVPVERVRDYETELYRFLETSRSGVLAAMAEKKAIDDTIKAKLNSALEEFGKSFAATAKVA
jgi:F-type H+-transporting ATPase subunit alpha